MAREQQFFAHEVLCRQTAVQFGDHKQAQRLTELAKIIEGPRVMAAVLHAESLERGAPRGSVRGRGAL